MAGDTQPGHETANRDAARWRWFCRNADYGRHPDGSMWWEIPDAPGGCGINDDVGTYLDRLADAAIGDAGADFETTPKTTIQKEQAMGGPYRRVTKEEFDRLTASGVRGEWDEGCGYVDEQAEAEFAAALKARGGGNAR